MTGAVWERLLAERRYNIKHTLGEGAYSKVKAAFSGRLNRDVAIKCISFRNAPKEFLKKFLPRELQILPKLRHVNIAQVYEILEHYDPKKKSNSYVCIVMEPGRNGDLLHYIQKKGALPEAEVKKFFWQLSQAINYCHSRNICHRDLKCENLLLGKHNKLLIVDFGFSKQMSINRSGETKYSETYCGSPAYAAPEILQGNPYDPRMHDMWSMGVILYIMSCGHMPFDDSNVIKMLKLQLRNQVRFPAICVKKLSADVKNLISRLMEVDVTKRLTIAQVLAHPFLENADRSKMLSISYIYRKISAFFIGKRNNSSTPGKEAHPEKKLNASRNSNKKKKTRGNNRAVKAGHQRANSKRKKSRMYGRKVPLYPRKGHFFWRKKKKTKT